VPSFEPELPETTARLASKISAKPAASRASSPRPPRELSIVLYGIASCSVCQAAQRHLQSKGLKYVVHDVARDSAAAARALSLNPRRTVPTIDLDGREVLLGFSPEEFDAALVRALVPTAKPSQ
jgi:glutaredoxin